MRKTLTLVLAACGCCLLVPGVAGEDVEETATATCAQFSVSPKIDGKLDEAVWKDATPLGPAVLLHGAPCTMGMEASVGHDGSALYIGVRCPAEDPGDLEVDTSERDGDVWLDESIEIFIDANRDLTTYRHFLFNSDNVQRDEFGDRGATPLFDVEWNGTWDSAVSKDGNAWYAECRIPFETVGIKLDQDRVIGLNVVRNDKTKSEIVVWIPSPGSLHQPTRFGALVLSQSAEAALFEALVEHPGALKTGASEGRLRLTNRSDEPVQLEWQVSVAGPRGLEDAFSDTVPLAANESKTAPFHYEIEGYGGHLVSLLVRDPAAGRIIAVRNYSCSIPIQIALGLGGRLASPEGIGCWWAPGTYKLRRDMDPPEAMSDAIELSAAANEYEPVQLVLRPEQDVHGATVAVSALKGETGAIPAQAVEVRVVEYVTVETPTDAFSAKGDYPDPLPPHEAPVDLAAGRNQPFWILVHVPAGTAAGVYEGAVTVTTPGGRWEVPLRARVRAFELTAETHTETAYGCGPVWSFLGVGSQEDREQVYDKYLACMRDHRIAPYSPMSYHPIQYHGARTEIQAGDLSLTIENLFSNQYFTIAYRGKVLGNLTNTMTQFEKEGVGWKDTGVGWPGIGSIRAREVARDEHRVVYDIAGFRGGSSPANRAYRITFRFVIPSQGNWFAATMLDLKNEDDVRYRADGYYYILRADGGEKVTGPNYGGWVLPDGLLGAVCTDASVSFSMAPIYVAKEAWLEPGQGTGAYGPWMIFFVTDGRDKAALEARAKAILAELGGASPEGYVPGGGTLAITDDDPGEIVFDFDDFDRAAEKYLDEWRFTAFKFGAVPAAIAGHRKGTPDYEELYAAIYGRMCEHLDERGWLGKAYCYWKDEPTEQEYAFVNEGMDILGRHCPGLRRLLTEQPEPGLFGHVDLWVPVLSHYDADDCRARQAAGDEVWWYVCCGPHAPYPNNFVDHPALNHRIRFWMMKKYGVTGSLYWTTTWWYGKGHELRSPWTHPMSISPSGGTWGNGDGMLLYPACREPGDAPVLDGPVPSLRFEMLREGLEDREYFWLLEQGVTKLEAALKQASDDKVLQCEKALGMANRALGAPDRLIESLTSYTKDPADLYRERDTLADAIEAVNAALAKLE